MNHYALIERLILWLGQHRDQQPSLKEMATVAGLSEFHFHRLFSEWAGITPKGFLQCLNHQHARRLLESGQPVLQTSLDLGLSGPSRLHDLCLTIEAATPGEIKSAGAGWTIRYGSALTPFGHALICQNHRGICHLGFYSQGEMVDALAEAQASWPRAQFQLDQQLASKLAKQIFLAKPASQLDQPVPNKPLRAYVKGTALQLKVWRALLTIPAGQLASYGEIASAIGNPKAARAVGTAIGRNPISYLIPCHRVIQQSGAIGGYRWQPERKQAMIAYETCPPTE